MPRHLALSGLFIAATLTAGLIVGGLNFLPVSRIVRPRLRQLAARMQQVGQSMDQATFTGDWSACSPENCLLQEQDRAELGAVAQSYNELLRSLHAAHLVEARIRNFTQTLSSRLDLHELGQQALGLLQDIARAEGGAIALEQHGEWQILAARGLIHPENLAQSSAFMGIREQATQHRIHLPPDVKVDAVVAHFTPVDVLLTPILHHGLILGWVILASAQPFSEDVPRLQPLLMHGLGLALNNALLHSDLQRVAALDPLTGVYNRRFGLKRLDEELARSERGHVPLSLLMLDLDHFKRVNDTFGHLNGDKVLLRTAAGSRELLREGDLLLRYGGEEFLVILPGASLQDAKEVAERIRFAISQTQIDIGDRSLSVTASIGVASCTGQQPASAEQLIALADARLYAAKAGGRNRVVAEGPVGAAVEPSKAAASTA